jgi:hypothetical protein
MEQLRKDRKQTRHILAKNDIFFMYNSSPG